MADCYFVLCECMCSCGLRMSVHYMCMHVLTNSMYTVDVDCIWSILHAYLITPNFRGVQFSRIKDPLASLQFSKISRSLIFEVRL